MKKVFANIQNITDSSEWKWSLVAVWPVKNRQMSMKVAQKMISLEKIKVFDTFTKIA